MAESLSGYRIFYEVANCKNISRAASQLYISQPAISKSIQKLEEQLGAKLFIRSSKGVLLTPEGQMLYETVQEVFSSLDSGIERLRQRVSMGMGSLRIGVSSTLCKHTLLPYLTEFTRREPNVSLSITTGSSRETLSLIEEYKVDVGLVGKPEHMEDITFLSEAFIQDCFVASPDYLKRLHADRLDSDQLLCRANLMMLNKDNMTRLHIENYLRENHIKTKEALDISDMDLLISFAKLGLGIAAVIKNFVTEDLESGSLSEIPLPKKRFIPSREIAFAYKKNQLQNPALVKFLDLVQELQF